MKKDKMNKKIKFNQVKTKTKLAWSNWITPVMSDYLLKCCDCGLVHKMQFKVNLESFYKKERWTTDIKDKSFIVKFRARRVR